MVRFTHASGQPVAGEKIQWSIAKFPEAMLTATDEFGESSLSFAPMVGGRFAVMFDGLMLAEGLSAGNTTIIATPANELYTELMETKPIKFTVLLTPPTELTFLDSNYSAAPFLLDEQQYHLQAFLGGGGRGGIFRPEEIHTTLTDPNGDTVDIKLKRTARRWLYQTEQLQNATVNNNGDPYAFSYLEKEIHLPVYDSAVNAQWLELKNVFDSYEQMLSSSITQGQLDPEHKAELQMKLGMVENALAWHGADLHSKNINIAVLRKYTSLLTEEENLGEPINQAVDQAVLPLPAKGFQLNYVCEQERDQINDTINKAVAKQLTSFTELDAAFLIILETVRFGLSIHIGAYVLVTGRTEEGRRASAYERLAGGAEVLLALIPVGMAIGRYAKATKAMRLQATAEKKLVERTLGQAYEQGTFTLAAVTAKQLEKRFAKIYKESKKSNDRLLKRIDAIDKKTLQLRDDIKKRKTKLDETEAALKQMETQRGLAKAERTPGIRTTPGAIASKKRNIASQKKMIDKKIDTLDKLPAKHKEITDALDAIDAGRYLDRAELQRMHDASVLPGSHDQFENAAAWRLYEKQVEEALAQKNPLWAGDNKVFIRAPYVRTNWGKRFSINKKITTKHPEPDHLRIDPDSFAAGDSKFYTWPDKTSYGSLTRSEKRLIDKHVLTVVDTIEKARLCQFHVVKKTANNVGKPATTVWQTVFDLPMVIVTPTNVPDFVKQMIKTRVRGAGRGVVFTTLKPQLDLWADLIPKIVKAK